MDRDPDRLLRLRRGPGGHRTRLSRGLQVALGLVVPWIAYHFVTDMVVPHTSPEQCLRGVGPDPLGGHQATSIRYFSDGASFVLQVPCTSYARRAP
ncbi:MAG TPA: hypothetical protein VGQ78_10880 [Vicinamibacteria bacterium]|nr:hypothetical protein [Vicinamibacteria bacterium]